MEAETPMPFPAHLNAHPLRATLRGFSRLERANLPHESFLYEADGITKVFCSITAPNIR